METLVFALLVVVLILIWTLAVVITVSYHKGQRRASELLRAILTAEQYDQLIEQDYIDIPSPSYPERVYRVPQFSGRVQVREKGKLKMWLCLQPIDWVPDADIVVIHKLMIEADEKIYLQKANLTLPNSW